MSVLSIGGGVRATRRRGDETAALPVGIATASDAPASCSVQKALHRSFNFTNDLLIALRFKKNSSIQEEPSSSLKV